MAGPVGFRSIAGGVKRGRISMQESIVRRFFWSRDELRNLLLHDLRARGKMEGNPEAKMVFERDVVQRDRDLGITIELHYNQNKMEVF
jgi:hypothetical protein